MGKRPASLCSESRRTRYPLTRVRGSDLINGTPLFRLFSRDPHTSAATPLPPAPAAMQTMRDALRYSDQRSMIPLVVFDLTESAPLAPRRAMLWKKSSVPSPKPGTFPSSWVSLYLATRRKLGNVPDFCPGFLIFP